MILTDEERALLAHEMVKGCKSVNWLASRLESAVLRKLRERPADAVLLTYDSGERELRFQNNGWPAAETPLHIIPEEHE